MGNHQELGICHHLLLICILHHILGMEEEAMLQLQLKVQNKVTPLCSSSSTNYTVQCQP
jgi:hypothetical protein